MVIIVELFEDVIMGFLELICVGVFGVVGLEEVFVV